MILKEIQKLIEKINKPDPSQIVELPRWKRRKSKVTLHQLYINFPYEVFKYDPIPPQPVKIIRFKMSEDLLQLDIWALVKSATRSSKQHKCIIQLHRKDEDIPWNWDLPCEIWCSCESFRYFLAYPLYIRAGLARITTPWNKVPAKVRNPFNKVSLCKHLVLVCNKLFKTGLVEGQVLWYPEQYRYGGKRG
jgi:hypothetical protein